MYDPNARTTVSVDASSHGLGTMLLQKQADGDIKPVSYISRLLSPTKEQYAQIEKEALAFTWACERFSDFLVGLKFSVEMDHKLLFLCSALNIWRNCLLGYSVFDFGC